MKAIIGGTGIDQISSFAGEIYTIETRFGEACYCEKDGIIYLSRHGIGHSEPPHKVNYKANIEALRFLGVDEAIAIYAVGSINSKIKPLKYGLVDDFIDMTGRELTFFDGGEDGVRHVSMSEPFDKDIVKRIRMLTEDKIPYKLCYVTTQGPRLETRAEIRCYREMGADVVGMTLASEATLLKEAGIKSAAICYSINWAAGIEEDVCFVSDDDISALSAELVALAESALRLSRD